jgi:hypothetical protein
MFWDELMEFAAGLSGNFSRITRRNLGDASKQGHAARAEQ